MLDTPDLGMCFRYKGSVKDFRDLPSDPNVGDLYIIKGATYLWNGNAWDIF